MTPSQRIEAAARADAAFDGRDFDRLGRADKQRYLTRSAGSLAAGYPELNGDSPSHWLAPNEATETIAEAYAEFEPQSFWDAVVANRKRDKELREKYPDFFARLPERPDGCSPLAQFPALWREMRSAYLNTQEQG